MLSTTWYVATTGSNSNAGTSLQPRFRRSSRRPRWPRPGDTVYIVAGTYHETVTPANSGTAGAPITYEPYDGGDVVVDGAGPHHRLDALQQRRQRPDLRGHDELVVQQWGWKPGVR